MKGGLPYLDLFKRHLKTEGFIVVRIQRVFLYGGFFLLDPLSSLHEMDFHVGIWGERKQFKSCIWAGGVD